MSARTWSASSRRSRRRNWPNSSADSAAGRPTLAFQAKYGRGDDLVQLIKESQPILEKYGMGRQRILTDLAGPFFTVVMEIEADDLADYERSREAFADPAFGAWFERMTELVESGSREFFTVEQ